MGLPVKDFGSPLCEAVSLGIHESQSRLWETRIGQSQYFWKHYLPLLKKTFKGQLDKVNLDTFYKGINKVEPSLIRVEADEVTYSLHVILRFELEFELIDGTLAVRDLPEAWNAKMKELLGIIPKTNAEGCLQDIHWSMGAFGYFPTYTLGNLYASHLFVAFEKQNPNWKEKVAKGNLVFIKEWLHQNVYQYGRQYSAKELLKKATGKPFNENAFIDYLNEKYQNIYLY
jgi:carboxypeptidase Taq